MIAYHRLKFGKGLPKILLKMAKAKIEEAKERTVRAQVYARDRRRCFFPGCRRSSVDLHHVKPRSLGGRFEPANLVSSCRSHHQWVTAGLIRLSGSPQKRTIKVRITDLGRQAGIRVPKVAA